MSLFVGNDTYSVNVKVIDEQHKQLLKLLNQLYSAIVEGKGKEILGKTLDGLVDYTRMHFGTEERLMEEHDYQELWSHRMEHNDLTSKVMELQSEYHARKAQLTIALGNFLKNWLAEHIPETDKRFGALLSVNRVKTPAFRQAVFNTTMEKGKRELNQVESKDEQLSKRIAHSI